MKILDFLLRNPIFLFVLLAWLVPMIGNILKKTEKARRARGSAPPPPPRQSIPSQAQPMPRREPAPVVQTVSRPSPSPAKSAEEVAREMRRILGLEPAAPKPAPAPAPPPVRRAPIGAPIERPPQPIKISTRDRKLELHADPHVGDSIRGRHLQKPRRQPQSSRQGLGNLGGRVVDHAPRSRVGSRFALDDLKRAIVLSEILAPPVALRPFEERRGH
ncbi:MAG: hypothetical protein R3F29_09840 [Planctomycetota bacterium]